MPLDPFFTSKATIKRGKRSWKQRLSYSTKTTVQRKGNEAERGYDPPKRKWDSRTLDF